VAERLSRKEIRQPDQFISLSVQIIDWIKAHIGYLVYCALGVLGGVVLVAGWFTWQKHREQQAAILLYEAIKLTHATARTANRYEVIEHLQKLTSDYGGTSAAALAYWHLGHLYFEARDYTAALTAYRQAQQRFAPAAQPMMSALATLDVGYAQEASGSCNQAVASFEAVLQLPAHWLRGEAYLGLGRCHESAGVPHQAIAVYERALSDRDINEATRQAISEQLAFLPSPIKE